MLRLLALALVISILAVPSLAAANPLRCGGDARTTAEVVEGKTTHGVLSAGPDTLCPDISDDRPPLSPNLDVVIGNGSSAQAQPGPGEGQASPSRGRSPLRPRW